MQRKIYFVSFDGKNYQSMESSKHSHRFTLGLGNYKEKVITVGCSEPQADCSFATELFAMITLKWSDGPDFSFGSL